MDLMEYMEPDLRQNIDKLYREPEQVKPETAVQRGKIFRHSTPKLLNDPFIVSKDSILDQCFK